MTAATAAPPPQQVRWYGWQTLLVDGGAFGLLVFGLRQKSAPLDYTALAVYVLGGPVIHLAHGNTGKGAASLGLRVGVPLALGLIGGALTGDTKDCEFCFLGNFLVGASIGLLVAPVVDAAALARERVPAASASPARFTISPSVALSPGRAALTLGGSF